VRADGKLLSTPIGRQHIEERPTRVAELFGPTYRARTILIWILFFVTYFVAYGIAAWLPTLYVKVGGLPTDRALSLTVFYGLTQVVVVFFWGAIADRLGRRRVYILALTLLALAMMAGFVAVAWLNFTGWPILAVVAFIAGIGNGATSSLSFLYASELFPTRMRALAAATCTSANRIGTVLAPGAIGILLAADLGLGSVFLMVSCVAIAGLISVVALAPETGKGTLEEASA
jgi:putative MFS transporter